MKYLLIILFLLGLILYLIIIENRLRALEQYPEDKIILTLDQYKLFVRVLYEIGREDGHYNAFKNDSELDTIVRNTKWDKTYTDSILLIR